MIFQGRYLGSAVKKMTFKATEEMRNISVIITAYGDASPQLELTVERGSEVTTSTTATTSASVTTSTTTTAVSTTTTTADDLICGDVDLSGEVSVTDIVLILQYCVNKEKYPIEGNGLINADADGDGDITPKDAYAVQLFDAKQIGSLPYKG